MKLASVDITRPTSSLGGTKIALTITDEASGLSVIRIEMELADFAACVTGQGHMPAVVERWCGKYASNIGKKREQHTELLPGRAPSGKVEAKHWVRSHVTVKTLIAAGWELWSDGVEMQQNRPDVHEITFVRYVDPA